MVNRYRLIRTDIMIRIRKSIVEDYPGAKTTPYVMVIRKLLEKYGPKLQKQTKKEYNYKYEPVQLGDLWKELKMKAVELDIKSGQEVLRALLDERDKEKDSIPIEEVEKGSEEASASPEQNEHGI